VALVVGLASFALPRLGHRAMAWARACGLASASLAAVAVAASLASVVALPNQGTLQTLSATIALTGLLLVAHGVARRQRRLGYAGVALIDAGYMLQLVVRDIGQAQAFALPAGLCLLALAYLEWRRGGSHSLKATLEDSGLAILLLTTFVQGVGLLGNGLDRYVYDAFLLFEGAGLLALGALLHWKRSFAAGSIAVVVAVGALLADPIGAMNTWYLMALLGLTMIGVVIFLEERRRQIPQWLGAWRLRLEHWE
jgi:hypothetical protein